MVDDLKIEIPIEPPMEFKKKVTHPFQLNGFVFSPDFNKNGDVVSYSGHCRNLFVKMISGKLLVMNSWHKFYHGENYSDFTWLELQVCMETLAEVFGEEFWKSRITKLTVSINLSIDAEQVMSRLISFDGIPMEPMRPRTSRLVYGKRFASTNYNVKVYNKGFEVKKVAGIEIPPTLRIEKEMKMTYFQKRRKNPIRIYTPMDLLEPSSFEMLAFEFYRTVWSLGFSYGLDPMAVKDFHDATVVVFMGDPDYRRVLKKKSNYRTYKNHERRYEELRNEFKVENYIDVLNSLLKEKLDFLKPASFAQKTM
ncbi:MAG: hypothetical protein ACQEW9_07035 [Bacteroidota bacterium]